VTRDEICCFVQRADAGPGDEFQIDGQPNCCAQAAQARRRNPDVRQIVAPRAAQHVLAAELRCGFDRRQIVLRLCFLDDAGDFDVEQLARRLRRERALVREKSARSVANGCSGSLRAPTGIGRRPTNS
jgi:hypothetical protein